jgi:hypothetical protein
MVQLKFFLLSIILLLSLSFLKKTFNFFIFLPDLVMVEATFNDLAGDKTKRIVIFFVLRGKYQE